MAGKTHRFKAKNEKGEEVEIEITVDEEEGETNIKGDGRDEDLGGCKRSKDGKRVRGKGPFYKPGVVTITINCDVEPPVVRIVAVDPILEIEIETLIYTITHEVQDKLVAFIKALKLDELEDPKQSKNYLGDSSDEAFAALEAAAADALRALAEGRADWDLRRDGWRLVTVDMASTVMLRVVDGARLDGPQLLRLEVSVPVPPVGGKKTGA